MRQLNGKDGPINTATTYTLSFLFECPAAEADALLSEINQLLTKELSGGVQLSAEKRSETFAASLVGPEQCIDASHGKIRSEICSKLRSIRTADELGAELRRRAYELIAPLEQQLRDFINQSMTNVLGFSWWDELGESKIKDNVASVKSKAPNSDLSFHPIEFTQFDHLVDIITGDLTHWKFGKPLTPSDLIDLVGNATDFKALKVELKKRTTPRSIWDNVFAPLFSDQEAWQTAKNDLQKTVIRCRHKVMHHRPMRVYEVSQLKEACDRIANTLKAKARAIQESERTRIRETATELLDFVKHVNAKFSTFPTITMPTFPSVTIPTYQMPTFSVPSIDLSAALSRQLPDLNRLFAKASGLHSALDVLNRAASVNNHLQEYLKVSDRISDQINRLTNPTLPFFESMPDELADESDSQNSADETSDDA